MLREFEERKKAAPLRDLKRTGHALDESPPRQGMTYDELKNRQIEVMNRKREAKAA